MRGKKGASRVARSEGGNREKGRIGGRSREKTRKKRRTPSSWSQKSAAGEGAGRPQGGGGGGRAGGAWAGAGKCLVDAVLGRVGLGQRVQLGPEASRLWAWSPNIPVLGAAALLCASQH